MQPSEDQAFKLRDMARSALETALAFGVDERVFERLACAVWAEAQRAAVPQWVACETRMPEESARVLIAHESITPLYVRIATWQSGDWWLDGAEQFYQPVRYWAELPQPPKETQG